MQKVLAKYSPPCYNLGMKENTTLAVDYASHLEFISISDMVDSNWAEWNVRFEYEGIEHEGFLGACPNHPTLMHEDIIQDVEAR
jgi:hypothetical protein